MRTITFHGNTLHLEGQLPVIGQKAPSFTLLNNDLSPCTLQDFAGKVLVLVAVPSLDTGVCDMEVRRFNKEAAALSDKVAIAAVSCDLPFAQSRWCGAAVARPIHLTYTTHKLDALHPPSYPRPCLLFTAYLS